ncbi:preprotein translocase subunit YajC [Nitrospira defluvii]|nr:preprotein translocase subunit YajC [Nitrospira defluvii]
MTLFGWFVADALAQTGGGGDGSPTNPLITFAPFILIFVIFYFLLIRPQQKKAKERQDMIQALKKGDRVVTMGGLIGTITNMGEKIITIQVADGVRVKVVRKNIEELKNDIK